MKFMIIQKLNRMKKYSIYKVQNVKKKVIKKEYKYIQQGKNVYHHYRKNIGGADGQEQFKSR